MNLYLVERPVSEYEDHWDVYMSMVVAAPNQERARHMHPAPTWNGAVGSWTPNDEGWDTKPENLSVTYLGGSIHPVERVILASFKAG